ncbi:MAG TPA: CAP domain-containing protein, partial [Chloroflexota bacterium]|nr:CAP domain-containing protein [Chloroflexota bacterium]
AAKQAAKQIEPAESFEAALLARVNADRVAYGLRALAFDPELVATARARAAAQRPGEALTHAASAAPGAPAGPSFAFQQLLKEAGVRYAVAGENLARPRVAPAADPVEAATAAHRALMASETHRRNILDPAFDRLAVGMTRGADGQIVFAQLFRGA